VTRISETAHLATLDPSISQVATNHLNGNYELLTRMFLDLHTNGCSLDELRAIVTGILCSDESHHNSPKRLVQNFRQRRASFLQRLFRNNSGFDTNFAYMKHLNDCATSATGKSVSQYMTSEFYKTGVCHLKNSFDPTPVSERIHKNYRPATKEQAAGYKMIQFDGQNLTRLIEDFSLIMYGPVERFFLEQFGAFPQLYVGHAAVTEVTGFTPSLEYPGGNWHSDESPISLIKGFFYVSDVDRNSGATRYLERVASDEWMEQGFYSSTLESRLLWDKKVEEWLLKNSEPLNYMEGKAGDIFLFDPNLLHKATPPKSNPRIGLHLVFFPGKARQSHDELYRALYAVIVTQGGTRDFPVKPDVNDIQSMFHLLKCLN